jgi:excisionase family DNA binding protein
MSTRSEQPPPGRALGPFVGADSDEALPAGRSLLTELLTAPQVASILQMKVSTIEDYARRGILPSVKVGRHRRFVRSQLEQAVNALTESRNGLRRNSPPPAAGHVKSV